MAKMFTGIIYCYFYKNVVCYVGQTTQELEKRHKDHLYSKKGFGKVLKMYEKHISQIVPIRIITHSNKRILKNTLNLLEIFYINQYNTYHGFGFNYTPGGSMGTKEMAMTYFHAKNDSENELTRRCCEYGDMIDGEMYLWTKDSRTMDAYDLWEITRNTLIGHQYTEELLKLYNDLVKKIIY